MAYTLSRASPSDIPGMVDVWYTCFKSEFILSIVPKSTTGFKWLSDSFDTNDPNVIHMVVTDDSQDPRRVVAFSRWVKHNGGSFGEWHSRWKVELPADMTEEKVGKCLFEPMHRQHLAAMGERAHYFLEVLATHEDYRKKGLGGKLIAWGCEAADREGLECYLDARKSAVPLYEKFGFLVMGEEVQDGEAPSLAMVRGVTETQ